MPFTLPDLPYDYSALETHIDAKTMEVHHSKHHQAYVDKTNVALEGTVWLKKPIEEVIANLDKIPEDKRTAVRNNGGGVVNHNFFWGCLSPDGGGEPRSALMEAISNEFENFESFKKEFSNAATTQFGSGWAWLVACRGALKVIQTANQDSPLTLGLEPILCLDVWEHAYYLKYLNRRPEYIDAFWNVVNWLEAENRWKASKGN